MCIVDTRHDIQRVFSELDLRNSTYYLSFDTTVCSPNFGNVIPLRISISNDQIMVREVKDRKNVCLVVVLKLDISSSCISCGETVKAFTCRWMICKAFTFNS